MVGRPIKFPANALHRWLAVAALLSATAGAAVGMVLSGQVAGTISTALSQSILIDASQFDENDISSHAKRRFASVSDDRTSFTAAAEIGTGDEVAIDVPLINVSDNDASVELTLEWPPQVQVNAESFWTSETFTKSVAGGTITPDNAPSPAPFTATTPQSSDTTPASSAPAGVAGTSPQVSDGIPTSSSPGLPAIISQTRNLGILTTDKPSGLLDNAPTSADLVTRATLLPAGVTASSANTANGARSTDQPLGVPNPAGVSKDAGTAVFMQPTGVPTPSAQSESVGSGAQPSGAAPSDGSTSTTATVDSGSPPFASVGEYAAISAPDVNTIFITYYDTNNGDLRFAKSTNGGTSWSISIVDSLGDVGIHTAIVAVDASNIFIRYMDITNIDVKFAKSNDGGASWSISTVDSTSSSGGGRGLAALDVNTLFVTYLTFNPLDGTGILKFAKSTNGGVSWSISTVDSSSQRVGAFNALFALDDSTILISYSDETNADLKFAKSTNGGVSWSISTVDTAGDVGADPSIAAPSASTIYISYRDTTNEDLKFARSTNGGTSWSVSTVDSSGNVGRNGSLAAPTASTIYISYFDGTNGDLKLAKSTDSGSSWSLSTVDSAGFVGEFTSLVAPNMNTILIAYYHGSNRDLKFAKWIASTFYPGTFFLDADGNGATDTVRFVLTDIDSDGDIDLMELTSDDATFGETASGSLTNTTTGTDNDEKITAGGGASTSAGITIGAHKFTVNFQHPVSGGQATASVTSTTWYKGSYASLVLDADTSPNDTIHFVLTDALLSDGVYDRLSLSLNDDTDFGQGTSDNGTVSSADDETIASSVVTFGVALYAFNITFTGAPTSTASDVTFTSRTWYTGSRGSLALDTDGLTNDTLHFVVSDTSSDTVFDHLSLSLNDSAAFNNGNTGDGAVKTGNDEQTSTSGGTLDLGNGSAPPTFKVEFTAFPASTGADLTLTANTWYRGAKTLSLDTDGMSNDVIELALADSDSNGTFDKLYLSLDDSTRFDDGSPGDDRVKSGNDEVLNKASAPRLLLFDVAETGLKTDFDVNPEADNSDVRFTSNAWFTGTASVDADADGVADTINLSLADTDTDGFYEALYISPVDSDFNEGSATDANVYDGNDERALASERPKEVRFGNPAIVDQYKFDVTFNISPLATADDVTLTSKTRFEASFTFNADANGSLATADTEKVFFGLSDTNSNGLYETMDMSLGASSFGTGALGDKLITSVAIGGGANNEQITSAMSDADRKIKIGTTYSVLVSFASNPAGTSSDAEILLTTKDGSPVRFTALTSWIIDADGDEVADDHVRFVLSDTNSDGVVDTIDISIGDIVFGETTGGSLTDGIVDFSAGDNTNDERFSLSSFPSGKVVKLGTHRFLVVFDTDVLADTDDARITSRWYVGTFAIDINGDQKPDTLDFVLVDPGTSEGLYTKLNLDRDDSGGYIASEEHETAELVLLGGMKIQVTFPKTAASLTFTQGKITNVVRAGPNRWLITVPAAADEGGTQDNVRLKVATPDDASPGFFQVKGKFRQIDSR